MRLDSSSHGTSNVIYHDEYMAKEEERSVQRGHDRHTRLLLNGLGGILIGIE